MKRKKAKGDFNVRIRVTLISLLTCVALPEIHDASAAGPPPRVYHQDYFVIGFWGDPPVDNLIQSRYADVKAAQFNVVMGGVGADTPDKAKEQRDTCEKYGLKVLFSTYGLPVDQLCNCDTTYGFLIRDHPAVSDFENVRARADEFRRERPGKLPFVNLFPNTASDSETGADSYVSYLQQFITTVQPEVLCFDNYPPFPPEADGRGAYCDNLDTFRTLALQHGIPFWCFVKAMPYKSDAAPTEAQLRWQVYTALAYGVKGILYSCYYAAPDDPDFRGTGMIDADGKPTERYAQVTGINKELKHLGALLFKSENNGVWYLNAGLDSPADVPVKINALDNTADFVIGAFNTPKDGLAIIIVNHNDAAPSDPCTFSFTDSSAPVMEFSKASGEKGTLIDENRDKDGIQLSFAPGDARVFLVERHT